MSKKDWKKQFYRVKQLAGQNLGRAARSEVLTEDLQVLEKRVDLVKQVCHTLVKKLQICSQSQSGDHERRLKKTPEAGLYNSMIESAALLGNDTLLGPMIQLCGNAQGDLAHALVNYEMAVETKVISPIQQLLENEIPTIQKLRKQLTRLTLDMDSVRTRYQTAVRQTQSSGSMGVANTKADSIRDELDEACTKVQQCRDQLATEMYNFVARESEYSELLIELVREQMDYHRQALEALDNMLPEMSEQLEQYCQMPVYGLALEEHLRRSNREIASVLEECICTLLHIGMEEEGLFRIAGSASRLKKLKAALNSGLVDMSDYIMDIPCVASALKQYLRELPEPLMTHALYNEWMTAAYLAPEERVNVFRLILDKMPPPNYSNLRYLIKFLVKLSEKSDVNKMTASNIGIVIGPNLMWPQGDNSPSVVSSGTQASIVETLILNAETLFPGAVDLPETVGSASAPASASQLAADTPANCFHIASRGDKPTAVTAGLTLAHQTLVVPLTSPPPAPLSGGSARSSTRSSSCGQQRVDVEQMSMDSGVSCGTDFGGGKTTNAKTELKERGVMRSSDNLLAATSEVPPVSPRLGGSTPNIAPQHNYHNDLYNTAFALHSLSSAGGWTDYLSEARSKWDERLRPQMDSGYGVAVTSKRDSGEGAANPGPVVAVGVGEAKTEEDFMCGGCNDSPKTTPPSTLDSAPPAEGDSELTTVTEPLPAALPSYSPVPPGEGYNPFFEGPTTTNSAARSPRTNRHGVKKPAPMPPGVTLTPEKSPGPTESGSHSSVSSEDAVSLERSPSVKPPLPERPNAPPPAPPEKPTLTKVDSVNRPANGMSSPRPDRPRGPPPERPPGPLPDRPHDRPMMAPPDRPLERPPSVSSEQASGGGGQRSGKPPPPRPLPPPRSAHKDAQKVTTGGSTADEAASAPAAERSESNDCSSPGPEETHL